VVAKANANAKATPAPAKAAAAAAPRAKAPPAKRGTKTATRYTPVVTSLPPGAGRRGRVHSRITGRRVVAPGRLSL
jgi:hypothetical protein